MSSKTAGDAIKGFSNLVETERIFKKYDEILDLISGPLTIVKDKLETVDTLGDLSQSFPGLPADYNSRLRRSLLGDFEEEVESAQILLSEIDEVISKLQTLSDTAGQRILERVKNKTPLTLEDEELYGCLDDCQNILIFFKLKSSILKHYLLLTLQESQRKLSPFEHCPQFAEQEEEVLELLEKLKVVQLPLGGTATAEFIEKICSLIMSRVNVFANGSTENGKLLPLTGGMNELLENICSAFGSTDYSHVFTAKGGEITDTGLIRDDEVIYVTKGEAFIPLAPVPMCHRPHHDTANANGVDADKSAEWIKLNVGGQLFYTSRTTLLSREPQSMLARMFDPTSNIRPSLTDGSGAFLIDRDPRYFTPILNYLRSGMLVMDADINPKGVLEEAQFFGIQQCVPELEEMLIPIGELPLKRRDVVNALITTPNKSTLRFQGVDLTGADLSYLDLRNVNFKYAKLRNAKLSFSNLSFCNFERADMTAVEMVNATLSGVRMVCAIIEGSNCANCNFQDPSGHNANMEGVNLRNAILEDSDLTGANLRVANLKNANLKATILRGAILAGADLENSDLTGSDLHEANLRGANLKDASLELMINPLHMAQAIR